MSVTITIANNENHVRQNSPELIYAELYDCQCADLDDGPFEDCPVCKGAGVVGYETLPFELNIANGNFARFWASLGFAEEYCGELDPRTVLAALQILDPALATRPASDGVGFLGCLSFDAGVDADRVTSYVDRLREIAEEASRREDRIVWS